GSFTAFWLHNNEGGLPRSCNPACSKSIQTWLRFGEIMRGSLRALCVLVRQLLGKLLSDDYQEKKLSHLVQKF
ncbi:hypothetical protein, partial [Vibrio neptunius]|uniref:hypothetical protein n=1 Tax=Vibrio neptunius TaxID=170651 RepID=UPI0019D14AA4|nr:hypothetical protein [Vibrio neptunius]